MIQQATSFTAYHTPLTLVKGNQDYTQQLQTLSRIAWQIAYTALWNGQEFSGIEKEKVQEFITAFIKEQSNPTLLLYNGYCSQDNILAPIPAAMHRYLPNGSALPIKMVLQAPCAGTRQWKQQELPYQNIKKQ